ncbi:alpha-N-acetylgalactosaminidase [candidate division KSB1 bacterium]|nr:alpha-N-acetylgalactosaminidase [candidate division KSB1 bacterium]
MYDHQERDFQRRDFIKISTAGLSSLFIASKMAGCGSPRGTGEALTEFKVDPIETVRIGYVGVGGMGSNHVRNLLNIPGAQIKAVCDIVPEKVERIQKWVVEAGQPRPTGYSRGEYDFERMCETEELDLVYTATPWRWHVPVCVSAMKNGKHAATEVPAAYTVDGCWALVETAEKYQKHCVMMENCCYNRPELMVLNMVRQGLFGEILHAEAGYLHDLRAIKFSEKGEGLWRRNHSWDRNGNLYPTHGLGPVAQTMNINRGDAFDFLVSMSSPSRGLQLYAKENYPSNHPYNQETFKLGDVNTSLIKTKLGKTIILIHDCNLPRPYSRINMVQGTKGLAQGWPNRLHIEGKSPAHEWEPMEDYYEQYDHPLWTAIAERGAGRGHGGMDYIEDYRLIQCLREGKPMDMDVYDAAAWSVVGPLSEESVANKSRPVDFPDFTRGKWETNPPLGIVTV